MVVLETYSFIGLRDLYEELEKLTRVKGKEWKSWKRETAAKRGK